MRGLDIRLTEDQTLHLLTGFDFFGGGFRSDSDARSAWRENRTAILRNLASDDPKVTVAGADFALVYPCGSAPWAQERFG